MKKLYSIFCLFIIIGFTNCSSGQNSNSLDEFELLGNVKSIKYFYYEAKEKFGEIVKGERSYSYFENIEDGTCLIFNEKGFLVEKSNYFDDGDLFSKELIKYDDNNKIISHIEYSYDGEPVYQNLYKYDDEGRIIQKIQQEKDSAKTVFFKETITYNTINGLDEESIERVFDDSYYKEQKYYNKKDEIIEIKWYRSDEDVWNDISIEYIGNMQINKFSNINKPDSIYEISEIINNDYGDIIKITHKNPDETILEEYSFKYEYDIENNWTQKIEFKKDKPICIVEREIEYY